MHSEQHCLHRAICMENWILCSKFQTLIRATIEVHSLHEKRNHFIAEVSSRVVWRISSPHLSFSVAERHNIKIKQNKKYCTSDGKEHAKIERFLWSTNLPIANTSARKQKTKTTKQTEPSNNEKITQNKNPSIRIT